jgi:hypothetical protein
MRLVPAGRDFALHRPFDCASAAEPRREATANRQRAIPHRYQRPGLIDSDSMTSFCHAVLAGAVPLANLSG